ncbi:MAG: 6-phosphogluconolactonase [Chroococcidiopsis sp. SAG 2025]|uniref:6-phosphogluconolactonase n=1 Tax=Chroococcidiopsis sp. SAG 2025 TaxID=171389 RepID=UPI0029371180|nr:6-phosphogluconolactonase [Chroococcidiopsis sp. SAG 2025]MDV2995199.1 6-phosphogluconolactonase [Chroococcidiopsis sp. SAG 2025]
MHKKVEVLPDLAALVQRSLELTLAQKHNAIQARGLCTIALSGGSTPKPLYEAIAAQALPWEKVHVFWGDERYVPPDSPDSNQRMARQAWLDKVKIPAENIHPMPTNAADPADAALQYETHLKEFFQLKSGEFPALDVNLLGMGDDGHTASLFPHTAALQVCDRIVTVGNKDGQPRITFTIPTINQARCTIFLVSGANKQAALAQVFASVADDYTYPARFVQPQGELWWLLDRAAGQGLQLPEE